MPTPLKTSGAGTSPSSGVERECSVQHRLVQTAVLDGTVCVLEVGGTGPRLGQVQPEPSNRVPPHGENLLVFEYERVQIEIRQSHDEVVVEHAVVVAALRELRVLDPVVAPRHADLFEAVGTKLGNRQFQSHFLLRFTQKGRERVLTSRDVTGGDEQVLDVRENPYIRCAATQLLEHISCPVGDAQVHTRVPQATLVDFMLSCDAAGLLSGLVEDVEHFFG